MDEEKKEVTEETTKEGTAEKTVLPNVNSKDGEDKEGRTLLDEARDVNKNKEDLIAREEKLQTRKEEFEAKRILGGNTQAGTTTESQKETPKEYAERMLAGN